MKPLPPRRAPSRPPHPCLSWRLLEKLAVLVCVAGSPPFATRAQAQMDRAKILESCRTIPDDSARLKCFEDATSNLSGDRSPPPAAGPQGWRLIRTPNPGGGKELVSIIHTADPLRSDPDLAGLMIRCSDTGNQVLVALITPLPLRARPTLLLGDPGGTRLEATVVAPGALILLPPEATLLANGPWQALSELTLQLMADGTLIRGVVPLNGLAAGLQILTANCLRN